MREAGRFRHDHRTRDFILDVYADYPGYKEAWKP